MRRLRGFFCILAVLLMATWSSAVQAQEVTIIADSYDDWSFDGTQGENNWLNGYYNLTVDEDEGDGTYQPEDFISFLNDGS